jgi:branched-chain amino acid transport system permease protein
MSAFLFYTLTGIFTGAAYAIAASGLVLTYSTTRVFNIAHGAVGMIFAFIFWDFSVKQGMPSWLALLVVLLVVAPAVGVFLQKVVVKDLGNAPVGVSLVVTVGLLVALIGVATAVWPTNAESRSVTPFFNGHFVKVGENQMPYHQVLTVGISVVVAIGLALLLTRTRVGTAMRASVDNPDLLRLFGGRPQFAASLAWAIGTSLAALAGILLASTIGLQYYDLTLLVISAYAAAMLGKLTNLPLTFVGAMGLGLAQSYVIGYLNNIPFADKLTGLPAVIPTVFLFAILVLLPQTPLRIGQVKGIITSRAPSYPKAAIWGAILIAGVIAVVTRLQASSQTNVGTAAVFAIMMLSLVLLTGYGGFVSLAQVTFAGVGAVAYSKIDQPNLLGLLIAFAIAAAAGALVAIPVLRLTGLYLALATLAFGQLMDKLIFNSSIAYPVIGNTLYAKPAVIFGWHPNTVGKYSVFATIVFVLLAFVVIAVRRGRLGRMLIAMRDSQAACGTLGLDLRWMRVGLFAASAGMAGLGGALMAGLRGAGSGPTVPDDFMYFKSLLLLLMVVVWGVTSVTGAALGGAFLMFLNTEQSNTTVAGGLFVLLGVGAVVIGRDPNGLANRMFLVPRWISGRLYPLLAGRFPGMALRRSEEQEGTDADVFASQMTEEADDVVAVR